MDFGWPIATTLLMFLSFWMGKLVGFYQGEDEGFNVGVEQSTPVVATAVLRWVRQEKDIHISDPEIKEIIKNINVQWSNEK